MKKPLACSIGIALFVAVAACSDGSLPRETSSQPTSTTTQRRGEALLYFRSLNRLATDNGPLVIGRIESAEEHRLQGKTDAPPAGYEYDYTFVAYTLRIESVWQVGTSDLSLREGMIVNGAEGPGTIGTWYGGRAPTAVGDRLLAFLARNPLEIENEIARRPHPEAPVVLFYDHGGVWLLEDRAGPDGTIQAYATNIFAARSGPLDDLLARIEQERSLGYRPERNGPEYDDHTPSPGYRIGGQDFHVNNEPAPPDDEKTVATEPDI